jgi:hypothetical protein
MKDYLKQNGYQVETWIDNNDPKKPEIKDMHFENYEKHIGDISIEVCFVNHEDNNCETSCLVVFSKWDQTVKNIDQEKLQKIEKCLGDLNELLA